MKMMLRKSTPMISKVLKKGGQKCIEAAREAYCFLIN